MKRLRNRNPIRSMTAITLLLSAAILIIWGVSVCCITLVTAQELCRQFYYRSLSFVDYADIVFSHNYSGESSAFNIESYKADPTVLDYQMLDTIHNTRYYSLVDLYPRYIDTKLIRDIYFPVETAVIFYDKNGKILHKNSNYIYFRYVMQEDWDAGREEEVDSQYGYITLEEGGEDDPYERFRGMYARTRSLHDIRVLRITGTIDGAEVKPVSMYFLTDTMVWSALSQDRADRFSDEYILGDSDSTSSSYPITITPNTGYILSELDRAGLLEWQLQFDNTNKVESSDNLVTIYAFIPQINIHQEKAIKYQGETYLSLAALTEALNFPSWTDVSKYASGGLEGMSEYSLSRIIHFSGLTYRDWTGFSYEAGEEMPEPELIMVTAIASYPLRSAVSGLRNVYIWTGILAILLVLKLRSIIKKRLVRPLGEVNECMANNWRLPYGKDYKTGVWREVSELCGNYSSELDKQQSDKNEITRLKTALDYAKKAELYRRQMVSNIAHELKTPLAIVHSYCEGLKEHIAEEKRERYLDVILTETERMDAMVLEMLDLSRLEAGKVKLSRDEFSLSGLARSVFDKLSALADEKELQVEYEFDGDCIIVADEARITQAVTNYASNAVQYTPSGGTVWVRAYSKRGETVFSVENTGEPLTGEELSSVWESFYRADKSRSDRGTGLGLAITKNIIELHGGKCFVRNTAKGVEFGFRLPN